jgi:cellobiose-specific phosphotransferase system component IIC
MYTFRLVYAFIYKHLVNNTLLRIQIWLPYTLEQLNTQMEVALMKVLKKIILVIAAFIWLPLYLKQYVDVTPPEKMPS